MIESSLLLSLSIGALAGVAGTGMAVWAYNRYLAPLVEFPIKKPAALTALPGGLLLGVFAAWRFHAGGPGLLETVLWIVLALAGGIIALRLIINGFMRHDELVKSSFERVEGMTPALRWRAFPLWQRALLFLLGPINQVGALRIHRCEITLAGLDAAFDGYRIVHVTDPHVNPTLRREWYDAAIRKAMALKPDLLLHGGDFITRPACLQEAVEVLKPLHRAPNGAFTVRGNHDLWKASQRVRRAARRAGMRLMSNEGVVIRRGEAALSLIGLEAPYIGLGPVSEKELRQLPQPRLALVHTPDAFPTARRLGCVLALAGHTHGGQVRMPLLGATVTSCAAGPRRCTGISRLGSMICIVGNGLGSFFPLRVLCPPEIVLIVLRGSNSA